MWKIILESNKKFEERMYDLSKHNPDLPYDLIREVALDLASKSPRSVLDIPDYEILYEALKRQQ